MACSCRNKRHCPHLKPWENQTFHFSVVDACEGAAELPQAKRTRDGTRRRGRAPPLKEDVDDPSMADDSFAGGWEEGDERAGKVGRGIDWFERKRRQHEEWRTVAPRMGSEYVNDLNLAQGRMQASWDSHMRRIQTDLDGAAAAGWMSPCKCCPGEGERFPVFPSGSQGQKETWPGHRQLAGRIITHYSLETIATLHLPEWECEQCKDVVSPRPSAFGCFPSTPSRASIWYSVQVLQLYRRFGPLDGLAATGELAGLQEGIPLFT